MPQKQTENVPQPPGENPIVVELDGHDAADPERRERRARGAGRAGRRAAAARSAEGRLLQDRRRRQLRPRRSHHGRLQGRRRAHSRNRHEGLTADRCGSDANSVNSDGFRQLPGGAPLKEPRKPPNSVAFANSQCRDIADTMPANAWCLWFANVVPTAQKEPRMNRSFPSTAREAFRVLVGLVMGAAAACTPNQGVKPGAPELIEFTIVQGGSHRDDGQAGHARLQDRDRLRGRLLSPAAGWPTPRTAARWTRMSRPDGLCRLASASATTNNWCTCVADAHGPERGDVELRSVRQRHRRHRRVRPVARYRAVRSGRPRSRASMTTSATGGVATVDILADYSATGDPHGLVFNLFGPFLRQLPRRRPQPVRRAAARVPVGRDRDGQPAGRQGAREGWQDAVRGQRPAARRHAGLHDGAVLGGAARRPTRWRWTRTP